MHPSSMPDPPPPAARRTRLVHCAHGVPRGVTGRAKNGGTPVCEGGAMAPPSSGRAGLVGLLTAIGAVATFEGARGVVQGTHQVVAGGPVSANVDSEYRFYSAWYAVLGVLLLGAARRPERETRLVRACAG